MRQVILVDRCGKHIAKERQYNSCCIEANDSSSTRFQSAALVKRPSGHDWTCKVRRQGNNDSIIPYTELKTTPRPRLRED